MQKNECWDDLVSICFRLRSNGLSHAYGASLDEKESIYLLNKAYDEGIHL